MRFTPPVGGIPLLVPNRVASAAAASGIGWPVPAAQSLHAVAAQIIEHAEPAVLVRVRHGDGLIHISKPV